MTRKNQVDELLTQFERKNMSQENCPYCHTDICYTSATGEREEEVPQKYLYNYESQDSLFNAAMYLLSKELCIDVDDESGALADKIKINYCPICGRKL